MQLIKALLVGSAALFSVALAQGEVAFTSVPESVQAGEPVTIEYSGDPNTPVTIVLRRGDPGDLDTVETITTTATGNSFEWTPETSLENGEDYALEIRQGDSNNFSGLITVSGGDGTAPETDDESSSASATASATETAETATETETETTGTETETGTTVTDSTTVTETSAITTSTVTVANSTVTRSTTRESVRRTSTRTSDATAETAAPTQSGAASELSGNFALAFGAAAAFAYLL